MLSCPVTPEVAGSSPVAPVPCEPCYGEVSSFLGSAVRAQAPGGAAHGVALRSFLNACMRRASTGFGPTATASPGRSSEAGRSARTTATVSAAAAEPPHPDDDRDGAIRHPDRPGLAQRYLAAVQAASSTLQAEPDWSGELTISEASVPSANVMPQVQTWVVPLKAPSASGRRRAQRAVPGRRSSRGAACPSS